MLTLASVNSKEEFLNVLCEGKDGYVCTAFVWVSKQLLWLYSLAHNLYACNAGNAM